MNKELNKEFEARVKDELGKVFSRGLKQGSVAICGIVLEEINKADKTAEEKIETLKIFCQNSLDLPREEVGD